MKVIAFKKDCIYRFKKGDILKRFKTTINGDTSFMLSSVFQFEYTDDKNIIGIVRSIDFENELYDITLMLEEWLEGWVKIN